MHFNLLKWLICLSILSIACSRNPMQPPAQTSHPHRRRNPMQSYNKLDQTIPDFDASRYESTESIPDLPTGSQPGDTVPYFTKSFKSKLLVSAVSATTMALLVHFVSMMLFSGSSALVFWIAALGSATATFVKGDFGDLCRAVGVTGIVLSQRTNFNRFLAKLISQSKATLGMAERRPFPPSINPWQYYPLPGEVDLQFSMLSVLLSIVFSGAYIGWLVVRPVPLLPNWIGTLGAATILGYITTLRDSRGDLLRYLGYSISRSVGVVSRTIEDVQLQEKASALLSRLLFMSRTVDSKYQIIAKLQYILADIITKLTTIIMRIRRDMNGETDTENTRRYPSRDLGNEGRRYGPSASATPEKDRYYDSDYSNTDTNRRL